MKLDLFSLFLAFITFEWQISFFTSEIAKKNIPESDNNNNKQEVVYIKEKLKLCYISLIEAYHQINKVLMKNFYFQVFYL